MCIYIYILHMCIMSIQPAIHVSITTLLLSLIIRYFHEEIPIRNTPEKASNLILDEFPSQI